MKKKQETTRKTNLVKSEAKNQKYLTNLTKHMDGMFENIPKIALKEAEKGNKIIRIGAILEDYHYRTWYGKVLFKFHYIDLEKHMQDYINNHPVATHKIRLEKYTYKIVTGDWPRRNYYGFRICAEFCC